MGKILLYYKYIDIKDPDHIAKWQKALCQELAIKGRILIAHEGINGTIGGTSANIDKYKQAMLEHELFCTIDYKENSGSADYFPRLRIVVKNEIVHLGLDPKVITAQDAGEYLTPEQAHALIKQAPKDLVLLDTRNDYESRVGTFENAITPNTKTFREFPTYIDTNLEQFQGKQVLMFCTGGVRCERASAYLKLKNVAKHVYHIEGGIHRYIEKFPDGYFKGKNYVFDGRVTTKVTQDILAYCEQCNQPYDEYTNCINAECNRQIIVCPDCIMRYHNTCNTICLELTQAKKVNIRTIPHKIVIQPHS